ncbi:hypothetical protein K435DRAFT_778231 [Dendrothele bispora CBS 962.96]|uniref:Uncharacterized protein n=1 Tax=Dendrothele bispora (strain CBS 962.96) TaxID=1314807 RepID=A0A4S8M4B8_DENBC|nr:hypothetical protein K435DRAFT_778231 [Dendrothele bispora CBS 962.96]
MMYLAAHLGASRTPVFSSWTLPGLIDSSSSSFVESETMSTALPREKVRHKKARFQIKMKSEN